MFRDPDPVHRVPLQVGLGFLAILPMVCRGRRLISRVVGLSDRAFTCATGHLRPSPDPWLELTLREAFADFDRDLATILHHKSTRR